MATYAVIDVTTGERIPGARVAVRRSGEEGDPLEIASSAEGLLGIPWEGAVEVTSLDPGLIPVLSPSTLPNGRTGDALWLFRAATLRVSVVDEEGSPVEAGLRILARPSGRAAGEWLSSPKRLGSGAWFDGVNPRLFSRARDVREFPALFPVPAGQTASVSAWAPGFGVASATVDLAGSAGRVVDVSLTLLPILHLRVRVLDPEGNPITGAQVTHLAARELVGDAANPEVAAAENALSGLACTFRGKDDRLRIQNIVGGITDEAGELAVDQPFPAKDSMLVLWADGYESVVLRNPEAEPPEEARSITLKRLQPAAPRYRFLYGGARIQDARVCLAEFVGEDLVGLPMVNLGEEGEFPSTMVVPGREYQLVLMGIQGVEGVTALSGRVTFGEAEDIDVTGLQK